MLSLSDWTTGADLNVGQRRLLVAAGLSLALHLLVLLAQPPSPIYGGRNGQLLEPHLEPRKVAPVLSVSFGRRIEPAADSNPLPSLDSVSVALRRPETQAHERPSLKAASSRRVEADQPPVTPLVRKVTEPGTGFGDGYSAVLMVDPDGRVGEILWAALPALTEDQLRTLERAIREGAYPSSPRALGMRAINEPIDVRGLLNLPPSRTRLPVRAEQKSPDAVPPAPTFAESKAD
jgi:hypothetical protein